MSINDIERIVRSAVQTELANRDFSQLVLKLLSGNDFESRIRDIIRNKLDAKVPEAISTYLSRNLAHYIRSELMLCLPNMITPLVKAEMIEKISSMSGVDALMAESRAKIQAELSATHEAFVNQRAQQIHDLQLNSSSQVATFRQSAEAIAQQIVSRLVGDPRSPEGQLMQGFKDELLRQNSANFTTFQLNCERKYNDLASNLKWINGILGVGIIGCLAYIAYTRS